VRVDNESHGIHRMTRGDGRKPDELRPVKITRRFTASAPGSVLIECGKTVVLCTACIVPEVPKWLEGKGKGWVTAEYDMLPAATSQRRKRNRTSIDGRTQEIQRLVGRSLRAVVDMGKLGENTIYLDCDVLQADGGTRTASITGAYVSLRDAVAQGAKEKRFPSSALTGAVAAVSVGRVDGRPMLDLDYSEDVDAEVDMNVVMTDAGEFVEVQGTGEKGTFPRSDLDRLVRLAEKGIRRLLDIQETALRTRKQK